MTSTATIGIGRAIGRPAAATLGDALGNLTPSAWTDFQSAVLATLASVGAHVHSHTVGAGIDEVGAREDCATFVASVPSASVPELAGWLAHLARIYGQRSIALTIGETTFVEAAE